uniref:Uncharacterized protein n=1 Tax=Tolypothrix bouteillei VB521301 TaxID=1479485 RepID=A0A0C1QUN0_9CYAN
MAKFVKSFHTKNSNLNELHKQYNIAFSCLSSIFQDTSKSILYCFVHSDFLYCTASKSKNIRDFWNNNDTAPAKNKMGIANLSKLFLNACTKRIDRILFLTLGGEV